MHGLVQPRACQGLLARIQAGRHEAGAPRRAAGHRHGRACLAEQL